MAESSCGNRDTQAGNNSLPKSSSSNSLRLTPSQALRRGNSSAGGSGNGNGNGNRNSSNSSSENNGGSNPNASNNGNNNNNNNNNRRRRNNRNSNSNSKNDQNGPSPPSGEGGETNEKRQQQQQRQRQRGNNKKGGKPNVSGDDTDANASSSQNNDNNNENDNNNNNPGENKGKKQRQRPKPRGKKGGGNGNGNGNGNSNSNTEASVSGDEKGNAQPPAKPKKSRNRNNNNNNNNKKKKKKNNNNNKKYPWRRHIPEGTVDPITLEELDTLEYPPFALVADEPYIPVREWPIPPGSDKAVKTDAAPKKTQPRNPGDDNENDNDNDAEDQNRQRLADQWGEFMLPSKETSKGATATTATTKQQQQQQSKGPPLSERPLNLFDGRALAFYMVSQLQFIDPFTRRDLTRPELVNLDRYLDRYGSGNLDNRRNNNNNKKQARAKNLRVTDAYDAKGITLSSAGAAAATARGRADILQQTAQQLLDSLFAGPQQQRQQQQQQQQQQRQQESTSTSLQEQYASLQRQERAAAARHERRFEREPFGGGSGFGADARGGGGGGGGFVVIDDDENPELRGRGHDDFPTLGALPGASGAPAPFSSSSSSSLYSASHIAGQRGRGGGNLSAQGPGAFPSLPTPASASTVASASALPGTAAAGARTAPNHDSSLSLSSSSKKPPSKPSKTLSKISGIVKKTTAEEKQRQWEAREMARRKAMMSNLTLGANHSLAAVDPSLPRAPTASVSAAAPVTDEQIQRNRAFAEALGVKPATQRHYASGWARPTTAASSTLSGDEHADELEAALYPDELVLQARDTRMPFLLKLEKRWKTFLNDDAAASLPLNRMDRASRKFVHHYAEFWNLKTESFDPEPNRYIHCVKLPETRMPLPLLSEVARNWRGPAALPLPDATRTIASFLNINNTNNGGNIHDHNSQQTAGQSSGSGLREVATKPLPMLRSATALSSSKGDLVAFGRAAAPTNSRSDALRDKERPRMTLLPRSVPLELPPLGEQTKKEATLDIEKDLAKRRALLEEKRQREKELEQKKRRALEDAFASDDDDDDDEVGRNKTARGSDDDSDWGDDQEPLYDGSDEE